MSILFRRTTTVGLATLIVLAVALAVAPMAMAASIRVDDNTSRYIGDHTTVDVPFAVSGADDTVSDVRVSLFLSHTWDGDLYISLIAPNGTTCILSNRRGGSGDNFGTAAAPDASRTTFDDAALTAISAGTAPFVGSFRPDALLSVFDGMAPATANGTWTLRVQDQAGADVGNIYAASLFIDTGLVVVPDTTAPVVTVPADLNVEATGLDGAVVDFASLCSATDAVDGSVACSFNPASGSTFAFGSTQVEVSAQDAAGNIGYNYFNINVADTTAPVVTSTGDVAVSGTSGWGAGVGFDAYASDAVDGAPTVTFWLDWGTPSQSQIFSPYVFPHGVSTVTCVAYDTTGNMGATTFDVEVTWTGLIQQVISELNVMLPTLRSSADRTQVTEALGHLQKAINPALWIDGSHLVPGTFAGDMVFAECKAAIEHLRRTGVASSLMGGPVSRLRAACRGIAETKIFEAEMSGGNATKLRAARAALLRGDQIAGSSPHLSIDFYKEAWKQATGSLAVSR